MQIMGMLVGKTVGDTFVVIDSFALPVEGTETRVNAQAEAYEYMVDFLETNKVSGSNLFELCCSYAPRWSLQVIFSDCVGAPCSDAQFVACCPVDAVV